MPIISVIVPIYNVEPYIRKCIDSILTQTFADFELILVDDGSTDSCPDICDEYAKIDNRIIVIHKQNGGVSSARNAGLGYAVNKSNSRFVSFVDGDDIVPKNYLQILYGSILKLDVDAVCIDYSQNSDELNVTYEFCKKDATIFDAGDDNKKYAFFENNLLKYRPSWEVWLYFFDKNIISNNGISFIDGVNYGEDLYFTMLYLSFCQKIAYLPVKLYFYRVRSDSAMRTNNLPRINDMNEISYQLSERINVNNLNDFYLLHKRIVYNQIKHLPKLSKLSALYIWRQEVKKIEKKEYFRSLLKRYYLENKKITKIIKRFSLEWIGLFYLQSFNFFQTALLIIIHKFKSIMKIGDRHANN